MLLTKAVAFVLLLTLVGVSAAGATVLCFGGDGHVSAEAEAADHHPRGGVSLQHDAYAHVGGRDVADHPMCLDVVFALASDSKLGKHILAGDLGVPAAIMPRATAVVTVQIASGYISGADAVGAAASIALFGSTVLRI